MNRKTFLRLLAATPLLGRGLMAGVSGAANPQAIGSDPLPSWNDGVAKERIVRFVADMTKPDSRDFVPVAQRIVTIDNDGTLWCEQPMYVQLAFAIDRVKALASLHPEWREDPLFHAALHGDLATLSRNGIRGMLELTAAAEAALTTAEFSREVQDWLGTTRHPRFQKPYTDLAYQPMLEMMAYLRSNGFKTFIVSGGSQEFIRPWAEELYGVPPEQVVGSTFKARYEFRNGMPVITRLPEIELIDNEDGKAKEIEQFIGRRPIMAFGNADGDIQMLEWTTLAPGPRLALYVHHDDTEREFAYDRKALFGRLDRGLDEAVQRGWYVISMKNDWKRVFRLEG